MQTYLILRRGGWATAQDLKATAARSAAEGERCPTTIRGSQLRHWRYRWLGRTVGVYQASSPEAIREHARRADMPADEIVAVADTVVVRP